LGKRGTPDVSSIQASISTRGGKNEYITVPVIEEIVDAAPKLATQTVQAFAPTINQAVITERLIIANFMTEGGVVATVAAITMASTVATIAVAIASPPKPVFLKIMAAGIGGVILGSIFAAVILRHYRKEILRNDAIPTSTVKLSKQSTKPR
jgi:hypothetical protein